MLLENKRILIMGIRNKWSIAWGAAVQAAKERSRINIYIHGRGK